MADFQPNIISTDNLERESIKAVINGDYETINVTFNQISENDLETFITERKDVYYVGYHHDNDNIKTRYSLTPKRNRIHDFATVVYWAKCDNKSEKDLIRLCKNECNCLYNIRQGSEKKGLCYIITDYVDVITNNNDKRTRYKISEILQDNDMLYCPFIKQ